MDISLMENPADNIISARLHALERTGRRRFPREVQSLPNGRIRIAGREMINFGSNDYLGLAHHPEVCAAFAKAASVQTGSTASSLIVGRSEEHAALENELADFEGVEAALLFPTGFAANTGTLQALATEDDLIFSERENHASLIDGCRSARGSTHIFNRHELSALRQQLIEHQSSAHLGFLVTDGVFSMDGTLAPLPELCDLAEEFSLAVIVDEAHGTGVLGTSGRGACEASAVEDRVFLRIGTLSKALGGLGGVALGSAQTIELLRNQARPQFFSTAVPPAVCAAVRRSLKIVKAEPQRREQLARKTQEARRSAAALGLRLAGDSVAPIVAILAPQQNRLPEITQQLQEEGWFVPAILPPTVPPGTARFRLSLTVDQDLQDIIAVLNRMAELLGTDE